MPEVKTQSSKKAEKPETMAVILTTGMAGHHYDEEGNARGGFTRNPGTKVELPIDEAERFLDRGYAELPEE